MLRRIIAALAVSTMFVGALATPAQAAVKTVVNVVSHHDDDLLFINPDIQRDIRAGHRVMTVYLTASDAGLGTAYWKKREAGVRAAYARMAGKPNRWTTTYPVVNGHRTARDCLYNYGGTRLCLLHLRLPGGNLVEYRLPDLLNGTHPSVTTVDGATSYTADQLIATVTAVYRIMTPYRINSLNWHNDPHGDHPDHRAAAIIAARAHYAYANPHRIFAYQTYSIRYRPVNLTSSQARDKAAAFMQYAPYDYRVCQTHAQCRAGSYGRYFDRRYIVASHAN